MLLVLYLRDSRADVTRLICQASSIGTAAAYFVSPLLFCDQLSVGPEVGSKTALFS